MWDRFCWESKLLGVSLSPVFELGCVSNGSESSLVFTLCHIVCLFSHWWLGHLCWFRRKKCSIESSLSTLFSVHVACCNLKPADVAGKVQCEQLTDSLQHSLQEANTAERAVDWQQLCQNKFSDILSFRTRNNHKEAYTLFFFLLLDNKDVIPAFGNRED